MWLPSFPSGVIKWVCYPICTHTNLWGKLKWPYAITRLTAHYMCGLRSDLVICKFRKCMVIHDTECPYWDQVSLNNTNQPILSIYHIIVHSVPYDNEVPQSYHNVLLPKTGSRLSAILCATYGIQNLMFHDKDCWIAFTPSILPRPFPRQVNNPQSTP